MQPRLFIKIATLDKHCICNGPLFIMFIIKIYATETCQKYLIMEELVIYLAQGYLQYALEW